MSNSAPQLKLRINLNLLHPKEIPSKLPEKFLKWLISYGRFIVILVEIIVVGAFLTRFKLDADLDELKRKINLDLPYVEGLAVDEALITQTQNKLSLIDKTYQTSDGWQETVVELSAKTPRSIQYTGLLIEEREDKNLSFKITATTLSNVDLSIFINNLKAEESLKEVNLATIAFDNEQISFTITGMRQKI